MVRVVVSLLDVVRERDVRSAWSSSPPLVPGADLLSSQLGDLSLSDGPGREFGDFVPESVSSASPRRMRREFKDVAALVRYLRVVVVVVRGRVSEFRDFPALVRS